MLLLDDRTAEPRDLQLHSIAHGVVALEQSSNRYGAERRSLRVVKLRGVQFRGGHHDYTIGTGGLAVFPRLVAPEHRDGSRRSPLGTGVAELDALLGGGLVPGTSTLVMGPTGTGKTSTATRCILAALERGERRPFSCSTRGSALSSPAPPPRHGPAAAPGGGAAQVRQIEPAELSPGEFVHYVRRAVEVDGARAIVIDSLNGYLHAMPNEQYLMLQMHELLSYLGQHGVMTLLILGQHGLVGEVRSDVDLSYLSDTIILMRFFEAAGEVRRGLSVVKTRTSAHEPTIREFSLGPDGLTIGAVLRDFDGVLSGTPVYRGTVGALMETAHALPAAPPRTGLRPAGMETAVEHRVLILAPRGRDAGLAAGILARAGMACRVCADLARPGELAAQGAGAALLTEEALELAMKTKGCCCAGSQRSRLGLTFPSSCWPRRGRHRARRADAGVARRDRQRRPARTAAWRRGAGERAACRPARPPEAVRDAGLSR